jgi:hypothetical protein
VKANIIIKTVTILGGEVCRTYSDWNLAVYSKTVPAMAVVNNKPGGIYFYNITFDGENDVIGHFGENEAIIMRGIKDVLVDSCDFQNYALVVPATHIGPIVAHAMIDNINCIGCHFISGGYTAIYMDGVFGSVVRGCTFDDGFANDKLMYFVNDDFTVDLDGSGAIEEIEGRESKFIVVSGNTFYVDGQGDAHTFFANAAHTLYIENNISGLLVGSMCYYANRNCSVLDWIHELHDHYITNNTAEAVLYYAMINNYGGTVGTVGRIGDVTVSGKRILSLSCLRQFSWHRYGRY